MRRLMEIKIDERDSDKLISQRREYEKLLDERLEESIKNGIVTGEQWFRDHDKWYETSGQANPYETPYHELPLLTANKENLTPYTKNTTKIFWGVGVGDSEAVFPMWDLEREKYSEICVIDGVKHFIETFLIALKKTMKRYRRSKVMFYGYNNLFENMKKEHFEFENSRYGKNLHICLGNTIGNFDQNEIFSIFNRTIKKEDYLLLGYHMDKNLDITLEMYRHNERIEDLIVSSLMNLNDEKLYELLEIDTFHRLMARHIKSKYNLIKKALKDKMFWDVKDKYIRARLKNKDTVLFRSRKYSKEDVSNYGKTHGFEMRESFENDVSGIALLERV